MELLKKLYCIHSKSGKEWDILEFIINWLFENIPESKVELDKTGNLYIRKGNSENCPCVVAHVDQVQYNHSDDFQAIETEDIIFGWSSKNKRFEGLGADDKNGVWICLQCLQKYDNIKCALFVGEETGCVGSNAADLDFFNDCRFVIQCDRRGFSGIINEAGCVELCDDLFLKDSGYEFFGFQKEHGMMTDVMTLKRRGLKVSCINVSCGYYEPHTDKEYTIKYDLMNCLHFVEYVIENCIAVYHHDYKYKPTSTYYGYGSHYYSKNDAYGGCNSVRYKNDKNDVTCNTSPHTTTNQSDINSFFDDESNASVRDFNDEDDYDLHGIDWGGEFENLSKQEMYDELYDKIYVLVCDCPSASKFMIWSSVRYQYPNMDWKDFCYVYGEVKADIRKYMIC